MLEGNKPRELATEKTETSVGDAAFSSEPFECPACGQMLAPSCRVCVACKLPIDPTQIRKSQPAATTHKPPLPTGAPARFSWQILFVVSAAWFFAAALTQRLLGPVKAQLVMGSVVILSSAWVFFDAQAKGVAKPLRWGLGSLFLWIVVFPWYLARRRTPQAPCPFVESETSPWARALLFILVLFFLLGAVFLIMKGPPAR